MKKIDVLAFGAHPDDVEACASGFLLKAKKNGMSTGIVDLTRGEASNFGTMEERDEEAKKAAKILKLDFRTNLNIPDEHVLMTEEYMEKVVRIIRQTQPDIILVPYFDDLHPDHAMTGLIANRAAFFAKITKYSQTITEAAHQPAMVLFYMLHTEFHPSFVLDVSDEHATKIKSIHAHTSQFFKKVNNEYTEEFHNTDFMEFFEARSRVYGYKIGARYGEPFLTKSYLGLKNFTDVISGDLRSLASWRKK